MKFTHKGWLMFCPIKIGDVESEAPTVAPRWFFLAPLFWLAEVTQTLVISLNSWFREDYEPSWYFKVTGEL